MELLRDFFDPTFTAYLGRMAASIFCGLLIGVERGYRGKAAGVRTNVLICMGATLFMFLSEVVAFESRRLGYPASDPARIAAQVVSGIGFLGAGAILRNRGIIHGLTSAASIWGVAAIGLAVGAGYIKIAVVTTVAMVAAVELFSYLETTIRLRRFRYMKLEVIIKKEARVLDIRKLLRSLNISFYQESTESILGETHYHCTLYYSGDLDRQISDGLSDLPGVRDVILLAQGVE